MKRWLIGVLSALAIVMLVPAGAQAAARWSAHGSARQVYVTGARAHARMSLLSPRGHVIQTKRADSQGGLLFRNVRPGRGYRVKLDPRGPRSAPVTVHSDAARPWDPSIYNQTIKDNGYQYLTTRDGTKLAIDVHPPSSPAGEPGLPGLVSLPPVGPIGDYTPPYPTLIEYSGYGYADPAGPVNGIAILANLMGFAVVDVNMRGTGCSGGAYDFFEPLQNLDGYDVIQTIAHQPWVLGHRVGMMGISYGAISQLFTAQLDPPSLAAISPLSTIDATATTLYPGGILNTGFAVAWAKQRQAEARPAGPHSGQPYAYSQIKNGDGTCRRNQALHGEATNLMAKIRSNAHYRPKVADPLDPISFVHKIHVPVFMACQWEDEQTGGHCPDLVQHMTGTGQKWFTFTNGPHIDSLAPYTYNHLYDFLELFVAHQAPAVNQAIVRTTAPVFYQAALGVPKNDFVTLPPDPIQQTPLYSQALSEFRGLPEVTVGFDNGAGQAAPGGTQANGNPNFGYVKGFAALPVPGTQARMWYLGRGGSLGSAPPSRRVTNWYTANPRALPLTDFGSNTGGGGLWGDASQWSWRWKQNPSGTAVSYVSSPLRSATTVIGAGAVHLWIKSSRPNVDLLATVSEVRPDGREVFIQNGYLRANERKLARGANNILKQRSTLLEPVPTMRARDVRGVPRKRFVKVVIPLYYEGHAYRAGSRIRVTISAPNGTQPVWSFSRPEPSRGTARITVGFGPGMPSGLVLPVVPGVGVPTGYPPCPSLRNEPCRRYMTLANR